MLRLLTFSFLHYTTPQLHERAPNGTLGESFSQITQNCGKGKQRDEQSTRSAFFEEVYERPTIRIIGTVQVDTERDWSDRIDGRFMAIAGGLWLCGGNASHFIWTMAWVVVALWMNFSFLSSLGQNGTPQRSFVFSASFARSLSRFRSCPQWEVRCWSPEDTDNSTRMKNETTSHGMAKVSPLHHICMHLTSVEEFIIHLTLSAVEIILMCSP